MERGLQSTSAKKSKRRFYFRAYFLLCSFYFLTLTFPAQAARLQSWRLSPSQNQLEFFTDDGVQPRAQLLSDPTRLVIDLPGATFGRPQVTETYRGAIRSIRVGQFDAQTTRLVVEYAPGYTIDPIQVRFQGRTANQWSVQLPAPNLSGIGTAPVTQPPIATSPVTQPPIAQLPPSNSRTSIQSLQATGDGFFLRTTGGTPEIRSLRSTDRSQMYIDIYNATISPNLFPRDLPVNVNGVSRVQITPFSTNVIRLTLTLSPQSPNWQASASPSGGLIVLPQSIGSTPSGQPPANQSTIVQSVELDANRQLTVQGNQPLSASAGWDRASGAYRVLIRSAQIAPNFKGPQLTSNSPLLQARVRQDGDDVAILLTPASGVQFGELSQNNSQQLVLPLRRGLFPVVPPNTTSPITPPMTVPPSQNPFPPSTNPRPIPPRVPNGRLVVVIDPGHGGPDPGAIGISGLQEAGLVLDISRRVQAILEQSGVQAILTRTADIDLDLQPRVDLAQRVNATVFVSIHANSINLSRPDISGLETYYYQSGLELARTIHRNVVQGTGIEDRGVRSARFYVLRRTSMPSVLVEVGFVTGRSDATRLSDSGYRQRMAESIARGVLEYLGRRS